MNYMSYLLHSILHEFVDILVILNGILVMKITAKSEHNVLSSIVASLEENVLYECIHTLIHIVIKEVRVILKCKKTKWTVYLLMSCHLIKGPTMYS